MSECELVSSWGEFIHALIFPQALGTRRCMRGWLEYTYRDHSLERKLCERFSLLRRQTPYPIAQN